MEPVNGTIAERTDGAVKATEAFARQISSSGFILLGGLRLSRP